MNRLVKLRKLLFADTKDVTDFLFIRSPMMFLLQLLFCIIILLKLCNAVSGDPSALSHFINDVSLDPNGGISFKKHSLFGIKALQGIHKPDDTDGKKIILVQIPIPGIHTAYNPLHERYVLQYELTVRFFFLVPHGCSPF